jgi:hypothetical protein
MGNIRRIFARKECSGHRPPPEQRTVETRERIARAILSLATLPRGEVRLDDSKFGHSNLDVRSRPRSARKNRRDILPPQQGINARGWRRFPVKLEAIWRMAVYPARSSESYSRAERSLNSRLAGKTR